jgi:2-hydroxy-3-keto-5-methylthiopentenyl-1-phosphate phosphatase
MGDTRMDIAVLCDFDGTITEKDTTVTVFNKFIKGNWKTFNERLDRGEITLEQCIREQFSMIKAPRSVILREADWTSPSGRVSKSWSIIVTITGCRLKS